MFVLETEELFRMVGKYFRIARMTRSNSKMVLDCLADGSERLKSDPIMVQQWVQGTSEQLTNGSAIVPEWFK